MSITPPARIARDGCWLDLPTAAAYAGVAIPVLARAIHRRDLEARHSTGCQGRTLVLDRAVVEMWAEQRESALR
ncbi:MAG: hypothetical protein QOI54_1158 [Actinomycetota bacterium]|jgi:hypothetical protein|nr:hypothetical protein [Actinomycetota bacterium]